MRIVSLLPSATEIVHALGMGRHQVGRSHECDHPRGVLTLPVCTAPKYRPDGTSHQIDQRVKVLLQEGLSIYRVDTARLRELSPDLIVTQDECQVCAATLAEVEAAVCDLIEPAPALVSLRPTDLESLWRQVLDVGEALGVTDRGRSVADRGRDGLANVAECARGRLDTPSIAIIEWLVPLMTAGNWTPELVELCGGAQLFGEAGVHSPWLEWDDLLRADPDVLIVMPCGFTVPRTLEEIDSLTSRPGWKDLGAVRSGRAFVADGHSFFNRPGPRIVESAQILGEMLHPDLFGEVHRGGAWVPVAG